MRKNIISIVLLYFAINFAHSQNIAYTPNNADSCYIKGIAEFYNQNYQIARMYFEMSWDINDSIQQNEPYISSNVSDWLAHLLYIEGKKEEAKEISIDYCFMPVDQRNTFESDSLWFLSSKSAKLNQALDYAEKARSLEIMKLGHEHYYIANSDQEIAGLFMQLEQWDSAKYYQEEAIDIFEKCIETDYTQNYIITLLEYIRTSVHLSDRGAYKRIVDKCKFAAQDLFGNTSVNYAYTLYEIARANNYFNDFADCISNAKESATIYSQFQPSKDFEMRLVLCYQLLGNAYGYFNNYQEANSYLQQASIILKKNKSIADEILFDLAYYQGKCGEYDNALMTYKELIDILDKYYLHNNKDDHRHTQELLISCHLDMAEIFYSQHKIDSTLYYASKGLSLSEKYNFPMKRLEALQTISLCYFHSFQYDKAIEIQEYILKENEGNMTNVYNLMFSYYTTNNMQGFYRCASLYYSYEKKEILSSFSNIHEEVRKSYLENGDFNRFKYPIRFAYYFSDDDSICSLAYNCELFRKGLLMTSSIEFSRVIAECDKETQDDYQYLLQIREELNHPIPDLKRKELVEKEQQLEGILLKQVPMWAEKNKQLQYSWKDIQSSLKENEIAIEFAEYILGNEIKMIALIIRKGWNSPRCVVLNEFDCNDDKVLSPNNLISQDVSTSKSIWGNILTKGQIHDHETIYFSADGFFRVFPIEYLCDPTNPKQTISDRFNVVRLSSTREVCSQKKEKPIASITLYGNLLYNVSEDKKITNSHKYATTQYCAIDNKRSPIMDDSTRAGYKYLYWTKAEIDSIEQYANIYMPQISVSKYELDEGTEESFKQLSNNSTTIIHLASHAFYYNEASLEDGRHSEGILLSGCNTKCVDSLTVEDGILCSSEIELLNLNNTSLVVLSGCNTGLGKTMVDGIGGLQRAFKKAGVGTLIISLWEVSDIATSFFMQNFYKTLFITKSKRNAFNQALKLSKEKFEDPYYWAAFIMLD